MGLFVLCLLLAGKLILNLSGGAAPSPVTTATPTALTPRPAAAAPSQQATTTAPWHQPTSTVSAAPANPVAVATSTAPAYTPPALTYSAGSSPTPSSTLGGGFGVAVITPAATPVQAATGSPMRSRPLRAAAKG